MRLPAFVLRRLQTWADRKMGERDPDFYIGGREDPYLLRWWIIPRNKWFNIYLHRTLKSDRDEALHDHPWINCSIMVFGGYDEMTIRNGGCHQIDPLREGQMRWRLPSAAHRLILGDENKVVSLFITGPVVRHWGFHCPKGWRHWHDFVGFRDAHENIVGRGCGEMGYPGKPGGRISLFARLRQSSDARPS